MLAKVSQGTQWNADELEEAKPRTKGSSKRDKGYEVPVIYDYIDLESSMDLEKLKTWCLAQWITTIRGSLINRNRLQYHACCNSFSRRHFITKVNHPLDETFDIHRLRDFKTIETGEDFFRWQLNIAKENTKNGLKTLFPSMNSRHIHCSRITSTLMEDPENKAMLRKRVVDLEHEVEEKKRILNQFQNENSRLLLGNKAWHIKYEELLDARCVPLEVMETPVKKLSNWLRFSEDN